eukprot:TRINITY_DN29810_c0_g1_i1.p1 TRINITY_DN29810_c0_g1~~TRINITY_DN29810_c0_g1_i1.p1  ORF type:complete len:276 (+),score=18.69 TRINITY_DN29810_c0_g1_i1:159-986(+)
MASAFNSSALTITAFENHLVEEVVAKVIVGAEDSTGRQGSAHKCADAASPSSGLYLPTQNYGGNQVWSPSKLSTANKPKLQVSIPEAEPHTACDSPRSISSVSSLDLDSPRSSCASACESPISVLRRGGRRHVSWDLSSDVDEAVEESAEEEDEIHLPEDLYTDESAAAINNNSSSILGKPYPAPVPLNMVAPNHIQQQQQQVMALGAMNPLAWRQMCLHQMHLQQQQQLYLQQQQQRFLQWQQQQCRLQMLMAQQKKNSAGNASGTGVFLPTRA